MSTKTSPNDIKRFEITCVYSPADANVDIILVHGLNGHPQNTWTAKNGVFWPTDLLPQSLKGAKARILVYGYNANVYAFGANKSPSSDMIHQHAQTLITNLAMERVDEDCTENPIIWVAHSLGGILVKRALELANDLTSKSSGLNRSIYISTYGIIFLGTPHLGSDAAKWGRLLQGLADTVLPKKVIESEPHLVRTLKGNNEILQNINLHFLDICQRFEIEMIHEAVKTDILGTKSFIVDRESAAPLLPGVNYYGIEATHSNMCKFESKSSPGYLNISTRIRTWVQDCPVIIQSRWVSERRERQRAREIEARELLGLYDEDGRMSRGSSANITDLSNSKVISTSMIHSVASIEPEKPSDILFIKPAGFRPNSLFVGRETELDKMHTMLFDRKRRAEGTSAVLLHCLPGGGKSCLARQYVYTHLDDFPGGIFWVHAKSLEQMGAGFWDIASKVVIKPSNKDGNDVVCPNSQQIFSMVHEWFCANQEWLLVLDGIRFDNTEELKVFIPDSKNSSLIYTSTERSVGGDHHFMNPQVIRLPSLSAEEALELFLLELDKKSPTQNELKYSKELVRRMDFVPLVIHVVAKRLKATEEPLAKFARTYAIGPKLRDLDTYRDVVGRLAEDKAVEALNLMNILCFFSQYIPFEMVVLGLKALDVPVKAYESTTGRTLNNSIKILNRFALVDRSDQALIHSSQSSKGSRDYLADDLDVIRLNSVVQDFFTDFLRAENLLPQWVKRAVGLFRWSYDTANTRINTKTNAGLVGDYRSYEIHGKRLLQHLSRNEKRSPALKEVREELEQTLNDIQEEIERRTRESSQEIAQGRQDAFQTSIFDRTSSSSDTGPETPSRLDRNSGVSTWGTEQEKSQFESPKSITFEGLPRVPGGFPELEDNGYDSDTEELLAMTARPSERTIRPYDTDMDQNLYIIGPQKPKTQPLSLNHRTVKIRGKNGYRGSVAAWRTATNPHITRETAKAIIQRIGPRPSVGHMSEQSQAKTVLSHISKTSPLPTRNGDNFQDRGRSLERRTFTDIGGRLITGRSPYSSPEAADTIWNVTSPTEIPESISKSSPGPQQATPAIISLRRFNDRPSSLPTKLEAPLDYREPYPSSYAALYGPLDRHHQGDLTNHAPIYPRQTGPLPIEYVDCSDSHSINPNASLLPVPYPTSDSFAPYPEATCHRAIGNHSSRFEVSNGYHAGGYTSQPMSRDPSGQSAHSSHSNSNYSSGLESEPPHLRRRPSLTQTEPSPQLSPFSPRILPTRYEIFDDGPLRKSPRTLLDHSTRNEADSQFPKLRNENNSPLQLSRSRNLNPTSPSRTQSQPSSPSPLRPSPLRFERQGKNSLGGLFPFQGQELRPVTRMAPGGVRVGNRVIGFGDPPELVEVELEEGPTEGKWAERDMRCLGTSDKTEPCLGA